VRAGDHAADVVAIDRNLILRLEPRWVCKQKSRNGKYRRKTSPPHLKSSPT
jgi:hypothetical protein